MTRAILTDIEGTTSSIAFVKEVLFPHARRALPEFVRAHIASPEVAREVESARAAMQAPGADLERVIAQLIAWIDADVKITPLKALQGMIWERGYREGAYRAHIYPDAAERLRAWHASGLLLFVYSSGSVRAQDLFFGHSEAGDLRPLFSGYFDTTTGPKQSAGSYEAIGRAIGLPAGEVLFLSDVEAELDAAKQAGMQTSWLVRPTDRNPSDAELAASRHPFARDFFGIAP